MRKLFEHVHLCRPFSYYEPPSHSIPTPVRFASLYAAFQGLHVEQHSARNGRTAKLFTFSLNSRSFTPSTFLSIKNKAQDIDGTKCTQ